MLRSAASGWPRAFHPGGVAPSTRFFAAWIGSVVLAAVVAVTAASLIPDESAFAVLGVAIVEGMCLGFVQRRLLRARLPQQQIPWLAATLGGVVIARGVQFSIETGPLMSLSYRLPPAAQYVAAAAAGIVIGTIMAIPQLLALRARVGHAGAWVAARAAGTAVTFVWLLVAQRALGAIDNGLLLSFAILIAVFAAGAAAAGAIEATVLAHLLADGQTAET